VARFSPEKHLDLLIRAFQQSALAESWILRLVGGGPEREALGKLIDERRRVELKDWVGYPELPRLYHQAAWFILPSRFEPWGLVVNEAMAAGLPVVVSDACGCAPDLVGPESGHVFPSGDGAALRALLDTLPGPDSEEWRALSAAARERIGAFGCDAWARALLSSWAGPS
jgi:glycosyltransferase involved in cell wall biosynthesis